MCDKIYLGDSVAFQMARVAYFSNIFSKGSVTRVDLLLMGLWNTEVGCIDFLGAIKVSNSNIY